MFSVGARVVPETPEMNEAESAIVDSRCCEYAGTKTGTDGDLGFGTIKLFERMNAMKEVA